MANICDNRLIVTGPAEERRRLVRLWTDGKPVFNRVMPEPDPFTDDEIARLNAVARRPYHDTDPVTAESASYWWRKLNWGTKWDVNEEHNRAFVEEEEDEVTIGFDTAWTPPVPVIEAMSALYPDLEFNLTYFEPGERFGGEACFVAGEGQHERYDDDHPEYRRIADDFGWEDEKDEDEEEEETTI